VKKVLSSNNIIPGEALADADWSAWRVGELAGGSLRPSASASERLAGRAAEVAPEEAPPELESEPALEQEPDEPPLSYPTAAELEAIHQEARQAGFEAGKAEGHAQGLAEGQEQGKAEVLAQFQSIWHPSMSWRSVLPPSWRGLRPNCPGNYLRCRLSWRRN